MMHLTHSLISQIVSNGSRLYSCYINYNTQDQVEDILDKNDNFSEQLSVGSNHNKAWSTNFLKTLDCSYISTLKLLITTYVVCLYSTSQLPSGCCYE